jgi:nucleoid-associated protein YgaU
VRGDGTWSFTYAAAPGSQVVAVQYQGRPGTRSNPVTFVSTGTTSGAATPAATAAARSATPTSAVPAGAGQAYIVQPGDFLRLLAFRFYGDEAQWPVIYNGTNAKAARDASFAVISDPNVIIVGWKLWIPAQ